MVSRSSARRRRSRAAYSCLAATVLASGCEPETFESTHALEQVAAGTTQPAHTETPSTWTDTGLPPAPCPTGTVRLDAGLYDVGATDGDPYATDDELPHLAELTRPFCVMLTEVTQGEYAAVMDDRPSTFEGELRPVETVRWLDAVRFANALSSAQQLLPAYTIEVDEVRWNPAAPGWRLPTEAEWEIAARGGEAYTWAGSNRVQDVAWTSESSSGTTQPVASLEPNGFGLYDMSGNVSEWVWDWYAPYAGDAVDPQGPAIPADEWTGRVTRGGSWYEHPVAARVAARDHHPPDTPMSHDGLRLVRNAWE